MINSIHFHTAGPGSGQTGVLSAYGELLIDPVIPPRPIYSYYLSWTPTNLSGSIYCDGYHYDMSEFSGYFTWSTGVITYGNLGIGNTIGMTYLETNATYIGGNALEDQWMYDVNLTSCSYIGMAAFANCYSMSRISMPYCSYIGEGAFSNCFSLRYIEGPSVRTVKSGAFQSCSSLSYVSFPSCELIEGHAFSRLSMLSSVNISNCKVIEDYAFYSCDTLGYVNMLNCEHIGISAFYNCHNLSSALVLLKCSRIMYTAFAGCSNINYLSLGYSSVCDLADAGVFGDTKLWWAAHGVSGYEGIIYVPSSLVDAYKSHSAWSYFSTIIYPYPS